MSYNNWLAKQLGGPQLPIPGAGQVNSYIGPWSPEVYAGTWKPPQQGQVLGAQAPTSGGGVNGGNNNNNNNNNNPNPNDLNEIARRAWENQMNVWKQQAQS
jgi:hypothetical protein